MGTPHLAQTGLLDLIAEAGLMAKFVMLVLLFASVLCWSIILAKWRRLKRAADTDAGFLDLFWKSKSIDEIYSELHSRADRFSGSPVAQVFSSGVKELRKLTGGEAESSRTQGIENIQRALARALNAEISGFEKHVGWLATTASAAPFVGLFGTVWGIMSSFQSIGASGSANLAVVAPGISEALITTAAGIAAAIPAVIAYNHFAGQIKRVAVDMECFSQDFLNIVQRSFLPRKGPG